MQSANLLIMPPRDKQQRAQHQPLQHVSGHGPPNLKPTFTGSWVADFMYHHPPATPTGIAGRHRLGWPKGQFLLRFT